MSKLAEKVTAELVAATKLKGNLRDNYIAIIDAALEKQRKACAEMANNLMILETGEYDAILNAEVEEPYVDSLDGTRRVDATGVQK